jgi:outer membrane protein OmpA-like peptidoglycan-associated protein
MKHLIKITFFVLIVFGMTTVQAQDENNPWSIFIGTNAVDFYPTGGDVVTPDGVIASDKFGDELFALGDNWNYVANLSSIAVTRYIGDGFSFEMSGSYNRIEKLGKVDLADDLNWINVDGTIQYNLNNLFIDNHYWFDPFVGVGGGYYWLDNEGEGTFNANLGVNFWISDQFAITIDTNYKTAFEQPDLDYFQHRAGIKFSFGGQDADGDGIYDKYDECPSEPGLEEFNGCPDSDSDGIADKDDACPDTPGLAEFNGCADTDGDGIDDTKDECPDAAGTAANNGCPDSDNDGLVDKADDCPNEAGPAANNGCPWPDTDGDGVFDKDDKCPELVGTVANSGCPEITESVRASLVDYTKKIQFNTGKTDITDEAATILTNVSGILADYPNSKFSIEGHTDSVGSAKSNKTLSEGRALSVKEYLVANGIDESRLSSVGYGEEKPISDNSNRSGRAQNRRVEIKLVK